MNLNLNRAVFDRELGAGEVGEEGSELATLNLFQIITIIET